MEVGKYLIQGGKVAGKRCTKCQQVLPLDQFSRKEKGSNRLKSHCKLCQRRPQEYCSPPSFGGSSLNFLFLMDIERLKYLGDQIDRAAHGEPVDAAVLRESLSWLPVSMFAHRQAIMALLRKESARRYVELKEAADYLRAPWRAQHFEHLYGQAQAELREINAALDDDLVSELRRRAQALAP